MSNLPPMPKFPEPRFSTSKEVCVPVFTADQLEAFARSYAEEAVRLERERLDAIDRMGPNGTIRIDDERGLAPRYIHWGGSTGLTLRDAIDAAIRARSQEGDGAIK